MITIQILIKNNQNTIQKTLESIKNLDAEIIIGNLGSTDNSIKICKFYNTKIIDFSKINNYSNIRNSLCKKINLFINPWEVLVEGEDIINKINETTNIYVFNNNIISKEIRIWKEEKFINPIYETIINKKAKLNSNIIIKTIDLGTYYENEKEILTAWLSKNPFNIDVYYYLSFYYLTKNLFDKFIFYSNEYFSRTQKINNSYINLKYYNAMIKLYQNKIKEAVQDIIICIINNPSHSEFWCLLGDIYYKQKQWNKAKSFYENALIIGNKRTLDDNLFIDIDKYKKYPLKMIENINEIIKNSEIHVI